MIHASVEKVSLLYGIIALLINFIGGGGSVKKLNAELCFVKISLFFLKRISRLTCIYFVISKKRIESFKEVLKKYIFTSIEAWGSLV